MLFCREEEETPTAEDKAPETEAPAEGEAAEKEAAPAAEPEKVITIKKQCSTRGRV